MEKNISTSSPLTADCCQTCFYGKMMPIQDQSLALFCCRHPPKVTQQVVIFPNGPQWMTNATNPNVRPENWCGEFRKPIIGERSQ